jgi:hypothetical protein
MESFVCILTQQETGAELFMFFAAVFCIFKRPPSYRKRQKYYVIYGGILLVLFMIQLASEVLWGQYMWIDHRNYPGGPLAFYAATQVQWYVVIGTSATALANIFGDGLLVRTVSLSVEAQTKGLTQWRN